MRDSDIIQSSEDIQQGDPLGPLLFCLSIHRLCTKLKSELSIFYLDDGTLGGHWKDIVNDLTLIEEEASALGLLLNRNKTELICSDTNTKERILTAFPEIRVVNVEEAELLGSPLGNATQHFIPADGIERILKVHLDDGLVYLEALEESSGSMDSSIYT